MQDDSLTFIPCYRSYIGSFLVLTFLLGVPESRALRRSALVLLRTSDQTSSQYLEDEDFRRTGSVLKEQVIRFNTLAPAAELQDPARSR